MSDSGDKQQDAARERDERDAYLDEAAAFTRSRNAVRHWTPYPIPDPSHPKLTSYVWRPPVEWSEES